MTIHIESWNSGPEMLAGKESSGEKIYYPMSDSLEAEPDRDGVSQASDLFKCSLKKESEGIRIGEE